MESKCGSENLYILAVIFIQVFVLSHSFVDKCVHTNRDRVQYMRRQRTVRGGIDFRIILSSRINDVRIEICTPNDRFMRVTSSIRIH